MSHRGRWTVCLAVSAALTAVSLVSASAAPAGAATTAAGDTPVRAGLKPIHPVPSATGAAAGADVLTVGSNGTQGVVTPVPTVYLVLWGSQWSNDPARAASAIENFYRGLFGARDTYDSIFTQYCEGVPAGTATCGARGTHIAKPTSTVLAGVWSNTTVKAPANASAAQIAAEAVKAARHFGNTTQARNLNAQYVILSPSGTHPDGFPTSGFCGWHSFTTSASGKLAYTNLPYVPDLGKGACTTLSKASAVDGYLSTATHEYAESLTDTWPFLGWSGSGGEIGDECISLDGRITLPTGTFDVQGEWSNSANRCVTKG